MSGINNKMNKVQSFTNFITVGRLAPWKILTQLLIPCIVEKNGLKFHLYIVGSGV